MTSTKTPPLGGQVGRLTRDTVFGPRAGTPVEVVGRPLPVPGRSRPDKVVVRTPDGRTGTVNTDMVEVR